MTSVTATQARTTLYKLIAQVQVGHDPVMISGKHGNAVLVSEDDWRSIEETMFLLSVPGMRKSITDGMQEPLAACATKIDL